MIVYNPRAANEPPAGKATDAPTAELYQLANRSVITKRSRQVREYCPTGRTKRIALASLVRTTSASSWVGNNEYQKMSTHYSN